MTRYILSEAAARRIGDELQAKADTSFGDLRYDDIVAMLKTEGFNEDSIVQLESKWRQFDRPSSPQYGVLANLLGHLAIEHAQAVRSELKQLKAALRTIHYAIAEEDA